MEYITKIFICLLIALTINVLGINTAYADNNDTGRPAAAVFNGSSEEIKIIPIEPATAFSKDDIYTNDSTKQEEELN